MMKFIKALLRAIAGSLLLLVGVLLFQLIASFALGFDKSIIIFFIGVIIASMMSVFSIYYIDTKILKE